MTKGYIKEKLKLEDDEHLKVNVADEEEAEVEEGKDYRNLRIQELQAEVTYEHERVDRELHRQELWGKMTQIEQHVFTTAMEYQVNFSDLMNATRTIEYKYKGEHELEQHYAGKVNKNTEHLWGLAYHTALYSKHLKMEIWKHHNPMNPNDPKNTINW